MSRLYLKKKSFWDQNSELFPKFQTFPKFQICLNSKKFDNWKIIKTVNNVNVNVTNFKTVKKYGKNVETVTDVKNVF